MSTESRAVSEGDDDKALIKFSPFVLSFTILIVLLAIIFVGKGYNFSSMAIFSRVFPDHVQSGLQLGNPKAVRLDEFFVATPWMLSQANSDPAFATTNQAVGSSTAPLLVSLPTHHFSSYLRPQFWGFLLGSPTTGLSAFYAFKFFGLILSVFLAFLLLTKNNVFLSVGATIWLVYSSPTQWWFSVHITELVIFLCTMFVSLSYLLISKKRFQIVAAAFVFLLFAFNFVVSFYPPVQVPFVYLLVALEATYLLREKRYLCILDEFRFRLIVGGVFVSLLFFLLGMYFVDSKEAIAVMTATSYPGTSLRPGGNISFSQYFLGFYEVFFRYVATPKAFINACEASSFLMFWPIAFLAGIYLDVKDRQYSWWLFPLALFLIISSVWVFWGLPDFIARGLLLYKVGSGRLYAFGIANVFFTVAFLSRSYVHRERVSLWVVITAIILAVSGAVAAGLAIVPLAEGNITWHHLLIVAVAVAVMAYSLVTKKVWLFVGAIAIYTLVPNVSINPLQQGIGDIVDKDLVKFAQNLQATSKSGGRWVVYSEGLVSAWLQAVGLNSVTGTQYTPKLDEFRVLDPDSKFTDIYNRFAHINFELTQEGNPIDMRLNSLDSLTVYVSPCAPELEKLGIEFFVFTKLLEPGSAQCLRKVNNEIIAPHFWVYRRN